MGMDDLVPATSARGAQENTKYLQHSA